MPDVTAESSNPFDYIVVCTKNIPDIPPTVAEIIAPAVTPGFTTIVLVQNGLNIEKPVFEAFPTNIVISGISRMSSAELRPGQIFHQDHDILIIGAFSNPNLDVEKQLAAANHFTTLYNASGKATGQYAEDVAFMRWRKLVYNASYNSLSAITGMDTSRLRLAKTPITELLLPIMMEIKSIARAAGVKLAADQEDVSLAGDAIDAYFRPSMQQDIEKVGEPARESIHSVGSNVLRAGQLYRNGNHCWGARKRGTAPRCSSANLDYHLRPPEGTADQDQAEQGSRGAPANEGLWSWWNIGQD